MIGNAVRIMKIATGENEEKAEPRSAAAELGGQGAGREDVAGAAGRDREDGREG